MLSEFVGTTPRAERFERLVQIAYEGLPGNIDWMVLEDSLRHLAGTYITPELMQETAWRLAGNHQRLNERRVVAPWHSQPLPEWVPVQVTTARYMRNSWKKIGCLYGFRILAGTACPLFTWKWWSLDQIRFFARDFGFSKRGNPNSRTLPRYPFSHPAQLVTLRLWVLLDPTLSTTEPVFSKVAWPVSVDGWNKEQIKARFRIDDGFTCPQGFTNEFECHRCQYGFKVCRAGTHRENWKAGLCPKCKRTDAWFDPELPGELCINCYVSSVYRKDSE